jgi:hypothetical protein
LGDQKADTENGEFFEIFQDSSDERAKWGLKERSQLAASAFERMSCVSANLG